MKITGTGYGGSEKRDGWNKEYTDRVMKKHRTAATLDHPDGSVTTAKIADSTVTDKKIANNAVTTVKIADSAVTDDKIGMRTIDNPKNNSGKITGALTKLLSTIVEAHRSEVTARETADNGLQEKINQETEKFEQALTGSVAGLQVNINTERTERTAADNRLQEMISSKAPLNHSSTDTTYGVGDSTHYGHVKLYDSISNVLDATTGTAVTPKALLEVHNIADETARGLEAEITARGKADKSLQDKITKERSERIGMDAMLQGDLTDEINSRTGENYYPEYTADKVDNDTRVYFDAANMGDGVGIYKRRVRGQITEPWCDMVNPFVSIPLAAGNYKENGIETDGTALSTTLSSYLCFNGRGSFTILFSALLPATINSNDVIAFGGNYKIIIQQRGAYGLRLITFDDTGAAHNYGYVTPNNFQWYSHYAVVFDTDSGYVTWYQNGFLSKKSAITNQDNYVRIGGGYGLSLLSSTAGDKMGLQYIKIVSKALSETEIQNVYNTHNIDLSSRKTQYDDKLRELAELLRLYEKMNAELESVKQMLSLTITTEKLPDGIWGEPYSGKIEIIGGKPPYTVTAASGFPGLVCAADGSLSGTPPSRGVYNSVTFTVTDSAGTTVQKKLSIVIKKRPVDFIATNTEYTYDGQPHKPTVVPSDTTLGWVEGTNYKVTLGGSTITEQTQTGTYPIGVSISHSDYTMGTVKPSYFYIKAIPITIHVTKRDFRYDGNPHPIEYTINPADADITVMYRKYDGSSAETATPPTQAGEYMATFSTTRNYTIPSGSVYWKLTITN